MDTYKNIVIGRTRRLDTKQFTVTIDLQSNKNLKGIVRIFLAPRINNKQQLNDNRHNFVELDQFIVKLNQGKNVIMRNSRDFKNVVGDPETMNMLYLRALNFLNKKTKGNDINNFNYDTNNNNQGFPHRLVLPKGTVGGEDYTLFVIVSDLDNTNNDHIRFNDNMGTRGINTNTNSDSSSSSDSNSSGDSNSSSDSNSRENMNRNGRKHINKDSSSSGDSNSSSDSNSSNDSNSRENRGHGNNDNDRLGNNYHGINKHMLLHGNKNMGRGNWYNKNGVMVHNLNNGNKNVGNGNGVLDNRSMGFPLDRQIIDVTGFVTNNMFFKDVIIFHKDNNMKNF